MIVSVRRFSPGDIFGVFLNEGLRFTLSSMTLPAEDLKEFQAIWKTVFCEELDNEEASVIASDFLKLYSLLANSAPKKLQTEIYKPDDEVLSLLQEIK